jgi:hypothetical protein
MKFRSKPENFVVGSGVEPLAHGFHTAALP